MRTACCPSAQYVFMDLSTYEETRLPKDDSWAKWLKVGSDLCMRRRTLCGCACGPNRVARSCSLRMLDELVLKGRDSEEVSASIALFKAGWGAATSALSGHH